MWEELDYLIVDTPPGTSDEHISVINYLKKTNMLGAVIVTTPQEVALADVRKEVNFCKKTETPIIGVVENMSEFVCPHCDCSSQIFPPVSGGATKMCQEMSIDLLTQIPIEPKLLMACEGGKCFAKEHPNSVTAQRFTSAVTKITQKAGQKTSN